MQFDNGLFALDMPDGWHAAENSDGDVFLTCDELADMWVSVQASGVAAESSSLNAQAFARSAYQDKVQLPGAVESSLPDGRYVLRWSESRQHEGDSVILHQGLSAWCESAANIQLLMFQAVVPQSLAGHVRAHQAQALAWSAPAELHFYAWAPQSSA